MNSQNVVSHGAKQSYIFEPSRLGKLYDKYGAWFLFFVLICLFGLFVQAQKINSDGYERVIKPAQAIDWIYKFDGIRVNNLEIPIKDYSIILPESCRSQELPRENADYPIYAVTCNGKRAFYILNGSPGYIAGSESENGPTKIEAVQEISMYKEETGFAARYKPLFVLLAISEMGLGILLLRSGVWAQNQTKPENKEGQDFLSGVVIKGVIAGSFVLILGALTLLFTLL